MVRTELLGPTSGSRSMSRVGAGAAGKADANARGSHVVIRLPFQASQIIRTWMRIRGHGGMLVLE